MSKKPALNDKQRAFVREYRVDRNATQAAVRAGYSAKTAKQIGSRLLTNVDIAREIERAEAKAAAKVELTVERTLQEIARIAFQDPRKLYREDGSQRPIHELDDDTAAAVASVEYGAEGARRVKTWDKNAALEKAMKHLGLFERDNMQQRDDIKVEIALINPPSREVLP
jgi:phage terminase small subunit